MSARADRLEIEDATTSKTIILLKTIGRIKFKKFMHIIIQFSHFIFLLTKIFLRAFLHFLSPISFINFKQLLIVF